ncbi:MAG: hypothetical protein MJK12_12185 [Colwellia sp.]|nr:hypothetical protein [Colwellia sp.]
MFTPITPVSDTELSKDALANMAITRAILQLSQLTQLNDEQCLSLIKKQLFADKAPNTKHQAMSNLINHHESDYIVSLFN